MTFGFSTLIDALSWAVALLLGLKLVATIVLLAQDRATWFRSRWNAALWWSSKITPVLAVPCLIAIVVLERRTELVWFYGALMLFVLVTVPIKIWLRFYRKGATEGSAG